MAFNHIITRLEERLKEDTEFIFLPEAKEPKKIVPIRGTKAHFAGYLVSVVTHPIGLRASISPYNASLESMLAYLMNMLKFSETQLKKMLIKDHLEDFRSVETPPPPPTSAPSFKKRHSWRPELRVRVCPPVLPLNSTTKRSTSRIASQMEDLTVRVYLFKDDQKGSSAAINPNDATTPNLVDSLRLESKTSSSKLIRPISEMQYELKFQREGNDTNGSYKTVIMKGTRRAAKNRSKTSSLASQSDDLYLKIRRYYCEPKSLYVLRLEFWLQNTSAGGPSPMRRLARSLVYNNPIGLCCRCNSDGLDNRPATVYATTNKSFMGFTNVKLSQIPAYAARDIHPVLSLHDVQVSTCELITEIRNRRLNQEPGAPSATSIRPWVNKSVDFVMAHVRLYAHCVGHHVAMTQSSVSIEEFLKSGVTLDNMLYLPAYAIINQHRLQANITPLEDQSLRRSALLMLLMQLENLTRPHSKPAVTTAIGAQKLLLVSILQHEYSVAHRPYDSRTLQEADPFHKDPSSGELARELVVDIESSAIQSLVDVCLSSDRLRGWLATLNSSSSGVDKMTTLTCLRLARLICDHNQTGQLVHEKLASQTLALEERINKQVSTIVADELTRKLLDLLRQSDATPPVVGSQPVDLWRKLLDDIQLIENDIILHWTESGLEGLDVDIGKRIQKLNVEKAVAKQKTIDFRELIENKMNKFLAS